mgnify:CR=1 FL=1
MTAEPGLRIRGQSGVSEKKPKKDETQRLKRLEHDLKGR